MKMWRTISNIGVTDDLDLSQQNKIILLNRIVVIFSTAIWMRLVNDLIDRDWTGGTIITIMGVLFSMSFLFNHFQKYNLARVYFITVFLVVITIVNILAGKKLGAEFCYFSIMVMTIIFFEKTISKVFYALLIILCYIICQFYFQNYDSPLSFILTSHSYHFMFFANIICTILSAYTFVQDNRRFSQQSIELLKSVEEQNDKLLATQLELEKQNNKLAGANKELEKFAYIASHDLKTPLRNVNSFLHLITRELNKREDDKLLEYISYASNSAKQMHYLIEDILEYSRLNGEHFSSSEINLNDLLTRIKKNIAGFIQEKNATIYFEDLPIIQGHESQVTLLFQNFIENGIKYNRNENPSIHISYQSMDDNHLIQIKDNGIGIEEEYFERIFEMFTRLHNQEEFQGSGIGLAICQKIVEYHGGKIELESSEKGTIFSVSFPKINAIPDFSIDNSLSIKKEVFDLN